MKPPTFAALLLMLAGAAFAGDPSASSSSPGFGYQAGFGYEAAPSDPPPSGHHHHHHDESPSREVTTITPLENGGTRIETRRYDEPKKGGRMPVGRARYGK